MSERGVSASEVARRLRVQLNTIPGLRASCLARAGPALRAARQSDARNQFTLWDPNIAELNQWVPTDSRRAENSCRELTDVNTDRDQGGLQANVVIDRLAASRLGVRIQDIDSALNNAFSQRQISTIYNQRNQYRVILEIDPRFQRDPTDLGKVYVPGKDNTQVPLSSVAHFERGVAPLVVNHQGQFPAVTISYELAPGVVLEEAAHSAIDRAVAELHMPDTVRSRICRRCAGGTQRRSAGSRC